MDPQNFIAQTALVLFVPVAFFTFRPNEIARSVGLLILGAVMFLPELTEFNPPFIPTLDKLTLSALVLVVLVCSRASSRVAHARPFRGIDALFIALSFGSLCTWYTNTDVLRFGPTVLEAMSIKDAIASILRDTLHIYAPFYLGRVAIRSAAEVRTLYRLLTSAGLLYSIFALFEVRFSPQLHQMFYGFMQMDWLMVYRMGGYRPMIFMRTGLAVGMFFVTTALAAAALARVNLEKKWKPWYLSAVLVACKSTGAIIYGIVTLPVVARFRRYEMRLAVGLAILLLTFPLVRQLNWFPTYQIVDAFENVSHDRASSLQFRFVNEDVLLERASERIVFGWGGYGRSRIFDPETGADVSTTDGDWIIELGSRGLFGFLCIYGLLTVPIFLAARRVRFIADPKTRDLTSCLALIVGVNIVDLLPNGLFNFLPYFYAGALLGLVQEQVPVVRRR